MPFWGGLARELATVEGVPPCGSHFAGGCYLFTYTRRALGVLIAPRVGLQVAHEGDVGVGEFLFPGCLVSHVELGGLVIHEIPRRIIP